jgi:hypothetical protein
MVLKVEFDDATAIKVAELFEREGMLTFAAKMWQSMCAGSPYQRAWRDRLAGLLAQLLLPSTPPASLARSRAILDVISQSFPTEPMRALYMTNLRQHLESSRSRRDQAGLIVLCASTGRSGSTTLAAAIAGLKDSCATHENPPAIDWEPAEEQVRFHFERLRLLADFHAVVFDASHWWLNVLGRFLGEFPHGRVIALVRETESCVRSFLQVKGRGAGTINHWAPAENGIWASTLGDPTYPEYAIDERLRSDPDAAKTAMIQRYVIQYNAALESLAAAYPDRVVRLRTEQLSSPGTAERLSALFGVPVTLPDAPLNVGTTVDSEKSQFRL